MPTRASRGRCRRITTGRLRSTSASARRSSSRPGSMRALRAIWPSPGSYITCTVLDQGIFVVRQKDGSLRGFYNVCSHRGSELLDGKGKHSKISCPIHGWTYDLGGKVVGAPGFFKERGVDLEPLCLKEVRVETPGQLRVRQPRPGRPVAEGPDAGPRGGDRGRLAEARDDDHGRAPGRRDCRQLEADYRQFRRRLPRAGGPPRDGHGHRLRQPAMGNARGWDPSQPARRSGQLRLHVLPADARRRRERVSDVPDLSEYALHHLSGTGQFRRHDLGAHRHGANHAGFGGLPGGRSARRERAGHARLPGRSCESGGFPDLRACPEGACGHGPIRTATTRSTNPSGFSRSSRATACTGCISRPWASCQATGVSQGRVRRDGHRKPFRHRSPWPAAFGQAAGARRPPARQLCRLSPVRRRPAHPAGRPWAGAGGIRCRAASGRPAP